jgi:hypothetical protein
MATFIGNSVFPVDFHAPAGEEVFEMKKSDPTVADPIRF